MSFCSQGTQAEEEAAGESSRRKQARMAVHCAAGVGPGGSFHLEIAPPGHGPVSKPALSLRRTIARVWGGHAARKNGPADGTKGPRHRGQALQNPQPDGENKGDRTKSQAFLSKLANTSARPSTEAPTRQPLFGGPTTDQMVGPWLHDAPDGSSMQHSPNTLRSTSLKEKEGPRPKHCTINSN